MSDVSSDEYPQAQINQGDLSDSSFSDNEEVVKEEVKVESPKPKPKPKRVMSDKQKASLEKGRQTAAANRLARKKEKEDAAKVKKEVVKIKEVEPAPEVVPEVAPPKKPKKKTKKKKPPTPPSSSDESSSEEEEIVLPKRKSKSKRVYEDQPPSLHFV